MTTGQTQTAAHRDRGRRLPPEHRLSALREELIARHARAFPGVTSSASGALSDRRANIAVGASVLSAVAAILQLIVH
jgi:hypothetical protein